jgi:hypothetical protein
MRIAASCFVAALLALSAGCQDVTAPEAPAEESVLVMTAALQTGPSNQCYGEIISGIARTWPWAHENKAGFQPPPGALRLWIETFGPGLGISSVRELQLLFCTT